MSNLETVQAFLSSVFTGDMDKAKSMISEDAQFSSVRPDIQSTDSMYGLRTGPSGAMEMFTLFGQQVEPGEFNIDKELESEDHVVMYGTFKHKIRKTGKLFESDWCLVCKVTEGLVTYYHFYEDSEAHLKASS